MGFREDLRKGSSLEKLELTRMRIQFASICLEETKVVNNEVVYYALSHLSQIPELDINLLAYGDLCVRPYKDRLNTDICRYTQCKLEEARLLEQQLLRSELLEAI